VPFGRLDRIIDRARLLEERLRVAQFDAKTRAGSIRDSFSVLSRGLFLGAATPRIGTFQCLVCEKRR
jgi:hypothetical protein